MIQNGKGDRPRSLSKSYRTNYEEINWRGEGDVSPSDSAFNKASHIRDILAVRGFHPVRVASSASGGVALVYASSPRCYADIECLNDGTVLASYNNRKDDFKAWAIDDTTPDSLWEATTSLREFIAASKVPPNEQ